MLVGCIRAYYSGIYFEHVLKPSSFGCVPIAAIYLSSFACVPIAVINLIPFLASTRLSQKLQATKASSKATTENKTDKGEEADNLKDEKVCPNFRASKPDRCAAGSTARVRVDALKFASLRYQNAHLRTCVQHGPPT